LPVTILGAGSNIVVRDGGIRGVVISLKNLDAFSLEGTTDINVGCGILDKKLAMYAYEAGLSGFEFLYTIPGTLGGALKMNAGAYGRETADCLVQAILMTYRGEIFTLSRDELLYGYRACSLPQNAFFVAAKLRGSPKEKGAIYERMVQLSDERRQTQPSGRTGGSTFKNPPGRKAWELIREAECADLKVGGASVSEKHCNFLMNDGTASASDIEKLIMLVQQKVALKTGVKLEPEVVFLGES
jgi:UDP-N-acetylmuramate dehydrogenase